MGITFAIGTTMVVALFLFVNYCWKRRPTPQQVEAGDRPGRWANVGLDPAVVETFPVYKYSEVVAYRADMGSLECAVCLSPFEEDVDEELRLLPKCSHVFHVSCVDPWLELHSTCPLCRTDLVPESDELSLPDSDQGFELVEVEEVNDDDAVLEVRGDLEEGLFEKHKRWKSMGHVAEVEWVDKDCWKRFTLNLPEEKMRKLGEKSGKFRRIRYSF